MSVERRKAEGLFEPPGYTHVAIAVGRRLVFAAGAVPLDGHGDLVGRDDVRTQARQVLANLMQQLEAGGAAACDVVKTTIYVADPSYDTQSLVWAWCDVRRSGRRHPRASA